MIAALTAVVASPFSDEVCAAIIYAEDFDAPSPPDGRILYDSASIYDALDGPENGGRLDGNTFENGYIVQSYDTLITTDQSGSGYFLHHRTGGGGEGFDDLVWGTTAALQVLPNSEYEFAFYLTNENSINNAVIQPLINGVEVGLSVSASGTFQTAGWQRFSVLWNSGDATLAALGLTNSTSDGGGNDFGIDSISLSGPAVPEPSAIELCLSAANP